MFHQEKFMSVRKKISVFGILVVAVCALSVLLQPNDTVTLYRVIPRGFAVASAHHDIRGTWKDQIRAPVISRFLAAYGLTPDDIINNQGTLWTMRIAIGDELVTALSVNNDNYILSAASPTGKRHLIVKAFMAMKWIPGLGRIKTGNNGVNYVNLASDDDPPLCLSLKIQGHTLMAKLSKFVENFEDMTVREDGDLYDLLSGPEDRKAANAHDIIVRRSFILDTMQLPVDGDMHIAVSKPADSLTVDAVVKLDKHGNDALLPFSKNKISGQNLTASALASDKAMLFLLMPAPYLSKLAIRYLNCAKGESSTDDAAIYLTQGDLGTKLLFFDIPAITADIPGINASEKEIKNLLKSMNIPGVIRNSVVVQNGTTLCSSISGLNKQRISGASSAPEWKRLFAKHRADDGVNGYLYADIDSLSAGLKQISAALTAAKSFGAISVNSRFGNMLGSFSGALPDEPAHSAVAVFVRADSVNRQLKTRIAVEAVDN